jgi:hypothetical protein
LGNLLRILRRQPPTVRRTDRLEDIDLKNSKSSVKSDNAGNITHRNELGSWVALFL